jgi:two-component system LytT family response regulator
LLADDEAIAIHRLQQSLAVWPHIQIIGEARDGHTAIVMINTLRPDLVFLDIQMPGFNGFEVLKQLIHYPAIVFVTTYESYAIDAFEKNALDYLLKPVDPERLAITIQRITQKQTDQDTLLQKITQLIAGPSYITTIPVKTGDSIRLIHISEVCYFEAKDKYVVIHTTREKHLTEYTLQYLQRGLPANFLRIHRSYIVNKVMIREMHKYFKGTLLLTMADKHNTQIRTAASYHDTVKNSLLNL